MTRDHQLTYTIRMEGSMSERWINWFGRMTIISDEIEGLVKYSTVQLSVPDQAAMLGALQKLHNLGYRLVEVRMVMADAKRKGS